MSMVTGTAQNAQDNTSNPTNQPGMVTVPVTSAWSSKVNWTQAVGAGAMILTLASGGKVGLDAQQQADIVGAILAIQGVLTWIMHTWFTPHVHAASLSK